MITKNYNNNSNILHIVIAAFIARARTKNRLKRTARQRGVQAAWLRWFLLPSYLQRARVFFSWSNRPLGAIPMSQPATRCSTVASFTLMYIYFTHTHTFLFIHLYMYTFASSRNTFKTIFDAILLVSSVYEHIHIVV